MAISGSTRIKLTNGRSVKTSQLLKLEVLPSIRSFNGLKFVEHQLLSVEQVGHKMCMRVFISNRRCGFFTYDQFLLTKAGWLPVQDLQEGVEVAVNGAPLHHNKDWLHEQYVVRNRSLVSIAIECEVDSRTIQDFLRTFGMYRVGYPVPYPFVKLEATEPWHQLLSKQRKAETIKWMSINVLAPARKHMCFKLVTNRPHYNFVGNSFVIHN